MSSDRASGRILNGDCISGAVVVVLGACAALAARNYGLGTLSHMGAGFFPCAIGIILAIVGLFIIAGGLKPGASTAAGISPQWRGWFCIVLGIVAFIALSDYGGMVPASFAVVFISALGDRKNS